MNQEESVVYVVDDDPSLRGAIDSLLRSVGWRVQTFVSAQDFLDSKPQDRHACLVLDVGLPGLSGLDLQSELIKNKIQIPVIFITGHADVPTSVRAMKAGAVEFLTKPFEDEDLLEAIRQAIEHDRTTREQHRDHQEELAAAARIQQGLMAVTALQPPFAEALGKSQPCREIGGDFFSVLTVRRLRGGGDRGCVGQRRRGGRDGVAAARHDPRGSVIQCAAARDRAQCQRVLLRPRSGIQVRHACHRLCDSRMAKASISTAAIFPRLSRALVEK